MTTAKEKYIIGMDLGDLRHAICVLNDSGSIVNESSITNTRDSMGKLAQLYPGAMVAIEVGSQSPWINRYLSELGIQVVVDNARKLRAIYQNERKSDALDAG